MADQENVVTDQAKWDWADLIKTEDWWSVWLGFFVLAIGMVIFWRPAVKVQVKAKIVAATAKVTSKAGYRAPVKGDPFKTVAFWQLRDAKKKGKAKSSKEAKGAAKFLKKLAHKPHKWKVNPLNAFYGSDAKAQKKQKKNIKKFILFDFMYSQQFAEAKKAEKVALDAGLSDTELNTKAVIAIAKWRDLLVKKKGSYKKYKKKSKFGKVKGGKSIFKAFKKSAEYTTWKEGYKPAYKAWADKDYANWVSKGQGKRFAPPKTGPPIPADIYQIFKKAKGFNQLGWLLALGLMCSILFGVGSAAMGRSFTKFFIGFWFVYFITILAWLFSYQSWMKSHGVGYAFWGILLGMLISNTVGTPKWVMPGVQTEYYIKVGLVLLGAKILFGKILTIGKAGIIIAWIVTPTVWLTTYWFGQKIVGLPSKRLNATICSDMSVCGVSAAIATASACRAKKEELTLAVGLSLIFTSLMMIFMPAIIKGFFHPDYVQVLGGAWMGGTIDATGAVAAAGAFLGDMALYVAATIKMIQNVLIGVIAFVVAIYFTTKVEASETGRKVGPMEIWYRFPKFVIGFAVASIVFSIFQESYDAELKGLGDAMVKQGAIKGMSDLFRKWFFTLSFVSIGLATNFRELAEYFKGGKPLILYICGQSLNLILTLGTAYLMFYVFTGIGNELVPLTGK